MREQIDRVFVATALVLVPETAADLTADDLAAFRARLVPNVWYDLDYAEYILGGCLHIFELDCTKALFELKWVFWVSAAVACKRRATRG